MKRILVIDDEPAIRRLIRGAMESVGYTVREAENGCEGLNQCEAWTPDVVITDIFMPEQDGLQTMRTLRKTFPRARIIAISGGGDMGDLDVLRTARAMGATTILQKPFDMSTLRKVVERILNES